MTVSIGAPARDRSEKIVPRIIVHTVRFVPLAILQQVLFAGLALFHDASYWAWHGAFGFLLLIPILVVLASTLTIMRVRALRWWAIVLAALYAMQIVLADAGQSWGVLRALHVLNAGLLLTAALVLVAKIERSHSG